MFWPDVHGTCMWKKETVVMAYVRNPILILKDARTAIAGDYSNSLSLSNICELSWSWIPNSLPEFVFSSACSMAWTSGKNPPGMNFSLVCRVQSGNVLSMKNIRDRPYCCNNYIYFNPETQIFLKWERPHSAHLCGIDFNFVIGDDSLWCFLSDRLTRRHE